MNSIKHQADLQKRQYIPKLHLTAVQFERFRYQKLSYSHAKVGRQNCGHAVISWQVLQIIEIAYSVFLWNMSFSPSKLRIQMIQRSHWKNEVNIITAQCVCSQLRVCVCVYALSLANENYYCFLEENKKWKYLKYVQINVNEKIILWPKGKNVTWSQIYWLV